MAGILQEHRVITWDTYEVNVAAGGPTTLVAAPGAGKELWLMNVMGTADAAGTIKFHDSSDTKKTGVMPVAANGGFGPAPGSIPILKCTTNEALQITTVTSTFDGTVTVITAQA